MNASIEIAQVSAVATADQGKLFNPEDEYYSFAQPRVFKESGSTNPNGLPSVPRILFVTNFLVLSNLSWNTIKDKIKDFLNDQNGLSFDPAQEENFTWICSYLKGSAHGIYQINAYWDNQESTHIIEVQRLEGDGFYFNVLFGSLRDLLADPSCIPKNEMIGWENLTSLPSPLTDTNGPYYSMDKIVTIMNDMLMSPIRETQLEGTMMACDMCSINKVDKTLVRKCIESLIEIVKTSRTYVEERKRFDKYEGYSILNLYHHTETFDWAGKHAIVALSNLSECVEVSDIICADTGFIQLILSHATVEGSIYEIQMRKKCAEMLINLIISHKEEIVKKDEDETLQNWLYSYNAEFLVMDYKDAKWMKKLQDASEMFDFYTKK